MKKILIPLSVTMALAYAQTVHYDKQKTKEPTVHYGNEKSGDKAMKRPNHPHHSLYHRK